jgi:hypothetical protein
MPPAAEELPTGPQPHRRQSRRVRKIDFAEWPKVEGVAVSMAKDTDPSILQLLWSRWCQGFPAQAKARSFKGSWVYQRLLESQLVRMSGAMASAQN